MIKNKHQRAEQQNKELHRNFADGVKHKTEPAFAKQAVFLEERYEKLGLDPNKPETWKPSMAELKASGV